MVAEGVRYATVGRSLGRSRKAVAHRAIVLGLSGTRRVWTASEDAALIAAAEANRLHGPARPSRFVELAARLGRSHDAVIQRARKLAARSRTPPRSRRRWTRREDEAVRVADEAVQLRPAAKPSPLAELAPQLKRTRHSLYARARALRLMVPPVAVVEDGEPMTEQRAAEQLRQWRRAAPHWSGLQAIRL